MDLSRNRFAENDRERQRGDVIQNLGDGDKVYVTGTPLKSDKGIDVVVCTERDITETLTLKELLEEKNKDNAKIKDEIEYLRKQNIVMWGNMIAEDFETKLLAEKATRVAKLDATVLLTGDSGTGKKSLQISYTRTAGERASLL